MSEKPSEAVVRALFVRRGLLSQLGFVDWRGYLRSELFARVRSGVLGADRYCGCGGEADTVRFRSYSYANLTGESRDGLEGVCWGCLDPPKARPPRKAKGNPWTICQSCGVNRPYNGGPCLPCLRRQRARW